MSRRMPHLIRTTFLILATLAGIQVFSGNIPADELFFNAMTVQNTTDRALLLIKAADAAPEKADAPLGVLLRMKFDQRSGAEICRAYNEFWKKHPSNPAVATCGILLYTGNGSGMQSVLQNLKANPEPWKSDGESDGEKLRIQNLNITRLFLHSMCADNSDGIAFASKLDAGVYSSSLSSFYNTMAYRFAVNGDEAGYKKMTALQKKATDLWISSAKDELPGLMINAIETAAKDKNFQFVHAVYKELENRLTDPRQLAALHLTAAKLSNDYAVAARAVSKLKNIPAGAADHLLFYAALRTKNFKESMRLVEKIPAKERANALRDIAITFNNAELYRKVLAAGNIPEQLLPDVTLAAAIACKDKNLYYSALRMLGKRQMTPELANSIGYTAAVLGIDMAEADKLLKFAVESAPFNSAYLDSLAWLCFRRQLYAEAQTYIDRALAAVDPNTPAATLLEHAGDIYRAQGNFYQAEKFYRRALEFSAGDPECDPARVEKKLKEFK